MVGEIIRIPDLTLQVRHAFAALRARPAYGTLGHVLASQ